MASDWTATTSASAVLLARVSTTAMRLDHVIRTLDFVSVGWRGSLRQLGEAYARVSEKHVSGKQLRAALLELEQIGVVAVHRARLGKGGLIVRLVEERPKEQQQRGSSSTSRKAPTGHKKAPNARQSLTLSPEERAAEERARAKRKADLTKTAEERARFKAMLEDSMELDAP